MKTRNFVKFLLLTILFMAMVILPNQVFAASKVGKVNKVQVKAQATSSVTIKWDKVSGASGYQVYMATSKNRKYKKVSTINKAKTTSYKKTNLSSAKISYFKVRAYKTIKGKKSYGTFSSVIETCTKPKTPTLSKLTAGILEAKIKWNKVSGASGYEIYMATSKNGKYSKVTTIKKGSTTSYTKLDLKGKQTYYFKIRAYKTVSGKKVYSAYSSKKSIKVKAADKKTKEGRLALAKIEAKKVVSKIITSKMTKQEKAEKICEYITNNVRSQSNQSTEAYKKNYGNEAYAALVMKIAACSGRCKAVTLLCDAAGLQSKHINQNKWTHQWNEIKVDGGKWIVIDAQIGFVGKVHPLEDDSDDAWIVF